MEEGLGAFAISILFLHHQLQQLEGRGRGGDVEADGRVENIRRFVFRIVFGDGAHLSGGRLAKLVAARSDVARPAANIGGSGLEGPLPLLDRAAAECGRALLQLLDVGLQGLEPGSRHALAQGVD